MIKSISKKNKYLLKQKPFKKGLVSIVIPCYKQGKYLRECLDSIISQTYTNWEAIVIDDGSPDETENICIQLKKEIKNLHYIKKNNGGLSSARNNGLLFCSGEYIQFLDADDLLEPNKLEYQCQILSSNSNVDVVYGSARYFDDGEYERRLRFNLLNIDPDLDWIDNIAKSRGSQLAKLINGNIFPVCAPMFRENVFHRVGIFNEALSSHEDWELWVRMALLNVSFYYSHIKNTNALIRVHSNSLSQNKKNMQGTIIKTRLNFSKIIPSQQKLVREKNLKKLLIEHQTFNSISFNDYLKLLTTTRTFSEIKIHLKYLNNKLKQLTSAIQ